MLDLSGRSRWIDTFRGLAIIAVVVDHVMYVFPAFRSESVWHHTYFSVPWFIFLSGAANVYSLHQKHPHRFIPFYLKYIWRRSGILIAYLLASMVSNAVIHQGRIDHRELISQLYLFSAQPTYYFINLLLQLYLLFPVLYWVVRHARPGVVAVSTVLIAIAAWGSQVIVGYPPWPFSPAGRVFGSIYLLVFWLGMVMGRFGLPNHWLFWIVALAVFGFTEWEMNATHGYFLGLTPTVPFILWAISLLVVVYLVLRVFPLPRVLQSALVTLGRYSIWIYLYHYLILVFLSHRMPQMPWFAALALILIAGVTLPLIVGMVWQLLVIKKHAILGANANAHS